MSMQGNHVKSIAHWGLFVVLLLVINVKALAHLPDQFLAEAEREAKQGNIENAIALYQKAIQFKKIKDPTLQEYQLSDYSSQKNQQKIQKELMDLIIKANLNDVYSEEPLNLMVD